MKRNNKEIAKDFQKAFNATKRVMLALNKAKIDIVSEFMEFLPMILTYIENNYDDDEFEESLKLFCDTVRYYRKLSKNIEKDYNIDLNELTKIVSEKEVDGYF